MVPCPWFLVAAEYCRAHPEADVGVHTTLTAEWQQYRWGPLSSREATTGMLDRSGFFPASCAELWAQAKPLAVERELAAQLDAALAAGVDVTHLDSHMGAVFEPGLLPSYRALGHSQRIPIMMPRLTRADLQAHGEDVAQGWLAQQSADEQQGWPLMDRILGMPLDQHENRIDTAIALLQTLPAGLTHFILHPAVDTPELRAIAPDWRARVADYEAFCSERLREYVRMSGIQVIGYRALRDALPAAL
jgi:predicted glycoside hydrolase/deacetylase ChbG (UPF0249 family)